MEEKCFSILLAWLKIIDVFFSIILLFKKKLQNLLLWGLKFLQPDSFKDSFVFLFYRTTSIISNNWIFLVKVQLKVQRPTDKDIGNKCIKMESLNVYMGLLCELTPTESKYTKLTPSFSCYLLRPPCYTPMKGKYIKRFCVRMNMRIWPPLDLNFIS